ncbi:MAG: diaminopropionate ammonia-lyase [candidate division Zixibacteria bacterium]|nr:diaminopropionate ammonia-lyase [candidate division Zixibacteria bacterium]
MSEFIFNPYRRQSPSWDDPVFAPFKNDDIMPFHTSLPGYHPTPLIALPALAQKLGVKEIRVKDESHRFDLAAFKVLGASYAIYRFLKAHLGAEGESVSDMAELVRDLLAGKYAGRFLFCTATDGNHGRAVAWTARNFHQRAVIYMPQGTVEARIRNIEAEGAEVNIVAGSYDETVRRAAKEASRNGWQVIADTGYDGYMTIPGYIMAGYLTMFREMEGIVHHPDEPGVDLVFLQSGVGSLAAAAVWYYVHRYGSNRPTLISVEPTAAACLYDSIRYGAGEMTVAHGDSKTIMAGLNCGTPSLAAWPIIKDGIDLFLAITDDWAAKAMRTYYHPEGADPQIISGESGSAGLAACLALLEDSSMAEARRQLNIGSDTRVLLLNTEGATDPVNFAKIIAA